VHSERFGFVSWWVVNFWGLEGLIGEGRSEVVSEEGRGEGKGVESRYYPSVCGRRCI
jgi:hypothetical protein